MNKVKVNSQKDNQKKLIAFLIDPSIIQRLLHQLNKKKNKIFFVRLLMKISKLIRINNKYIQINCKMRNQIIIKLSFRDKYQLIKIYNILIYLKINYNLIVRKQFLKNLKKIN